MTPTLTQVRTALQNLAVKKGRPDYELCLAKQVKFALENGLEHHLIAELPFFEIKKLDVKEEPLRDVVPRSYPTEAQALEIVTWRKNFQGRYVDLAKIAGCQNGSIHHIKAGRTNCTLEMYKKLTKARKELEGVKA